VHMPNMLCILTNGHPGVCLLDIHVEGVYMYFQSITPYTINHFYRLTQCVDTICLKTVEWLQRKYDTGSLSFTAKLLET
jgi:hypothetical protein